MVRVQETLELLTGSQEFPGYCFRVGQELENIQISYHEKIPPFGEIITWCTFTEPT